jgi:hypothetical protein
MVSRWPCRRPILPAIVARNGLRRLRLSIAARPFAFEHAPHYLKPVFGHAVVAPHDVVRGGQAHPSRSSTTRSAPSLPSHARTPHGDDSLTCLPAYALCRTSALPRQPAPSPPGSMTKVRGNTCERRPGGSVEYARPACCEPFSGLRKTPSVTCWPISSPDVASSRSSSATMGASSLVNRTTTWRRSGCGGRRSGAR